MIKGLTEEQKFKVLRPLFGEHDYDKYNRPIIKRITEQDIDVEKLIPIPIYNISANTVNPNNFGLSFAYDYRLDYYWNEPLKYIPMLQTAMAVATPDYSLYHGMNINDMSYNVYRGRWLGCLWQDYGIKPIPTIPWCEPDTYDICFTGYEEGGIVIISTLGCSSNYDVFINGFNEMKRRINPSLIIVFGNMLPGMTGRFINYTYKEAINAKYEQKQYMLFEISKIFEIK